MKKYVIGGYVRDILRGAQPHDRDYVVVGATVEKMLRQMVADGKMFIFMGQL